VLIVHHKPEIRRVLPEALEAGGVAAATVPSGEDSRPEVILLDREHRSRSVILRASGTAD
jgi:hypothetical protein